MAHPRLYPEAKRPTHGLVRDRLSTVHMNDCPEQGQSVPWRFADQFTAQGILARVAAIDTLYWCGHCRPDKVLAERAVA